MTTLSSKIINIHKRKMAQIAVDAVLSVADLDGVLGTEGAGATHKYLSILQLRDPNAHAHC